MLRRRILASAMASVMAIGSVAVVASAEDTAAATKQVKTKADLEALVKSYDSFRAKEINDYGSMSGEKFLDALEYADNDPSGGAISMNNKGGALAFNEQQLMNELSGLKKGGALGALAATVIPTLIQMAPQIISAIKESSKAQGGRNTSGGAIKLGGAAAVFIDGVEPDKFA